MRTISKRRALFSLATIAALAAPATASAHPGVFKVTAKIVDPAFTGPDPATEANLVDQIQYAVGNDGFAGVWRESNGVTGHGMIQYKAMPSAHGFRASYSAAQKLAYAAAQTDLQTHATCDTPALTSSANIIAWQDAADPFFNYVPFQKVTAILGDDPADWIPVVQSATGVNLASLNTAAEFQAACEALPGPGVYHPADAVVTTGASLAAGLIAAAVTPVQAMVDALTTEKAALQTQVTTLTNDKTGLQGQVATLTTDKTTLQGQVATLTTDKTTLQGQVATLNGELARLKLAATPFRLAAITSATTTEVSVNGVEVRLSGPPSSVAQVRMLISETLAKKLGLRSRVLATATATIGIDRDATVTLKPTATAAKAMQRSGRGFRISVDARSGDRYALVIATLTR